MSIKKDNVLHSFYIELDVNGITAVHFRVAEIILTFINKYGKLAFPQIVLKVQGDSIKLRE